MASIVRRGTKQRPKFYAQYRDANKKRCMRLLRGATTLEHARVLLAAIELRISRGEVGIKEPTREERARSTITIEELSQRFVKEYAPPHLKNAAAYQLDAESTHRVRILPALGRYAAASVTRADVERLRDEQVARGYAGASVVQTLAALSKLYEWAFRAELIDCRNPVVGVARPRTQKSFDYLSRDEVGNLLAVASREAPRVCPMIETAIFTGMRKGELFGLRWSDVHFDEERIDVMRSYRGRTKSGKPRYLPVHPDLAVTLRTWKHQCPESAEGLVFPIETQRGARMGDSGDMCGLEELLELAKCRLPEDGKVWHMLRHTFASQAVMAGMSLYDVQQLLGHASITDTQRYAHLAPHHLSAAIARLSFAVRSPAGTASLGEARRRKVSES